MTEIEKDSLNNLNKRLKQFAVDRNWEQFHNPKNLSMALIGEAAELVEHFQWLTVEQSENLDKHKQHEVALEIADIQIYLIRIAEVLGIDIIASTYEKIAINETRFAKSVSQEPSKF